MILIPLMKGVALQVPMEALVEAIIASDQKEKLIRLLTAPNNGQAAVAESAPPRDLTVGEVDDLLESERIAWLMAAFGIKQEIAEKLADLPFKDVVLMDNEDLRQVFGLSIGEAIDLSGQIERKFGKRPRRR